MKKTISLSVMAGLVCLFSVKAFAGLPEAKALYDAKKYVEAEAEYRKCLPDLTGDDVSLAQIQIGACLEMQGRYDEAIAAYRNASIKENSRFYSYAQYRLGLCLQTQKKYDAAIAAYRNVSIRGNPGTYSYAQYQIGLCLELQNKIPEAQKTYLTICNRGGNIGIFKAALDKIDPVLVGKDKYLEYLNKLFLVVPAKAENAEFLGYIKSEIEKLQ